MNRLEFRVCRDPTYKKVTYISIYTTTPTVKEESKIFTLRLFVFVPRNIKIVKLSTLKNVFLNLPCSKHFIHFANSEALKIHKINRL